MNCGVSCGDCLEKGTDTNGAASIEDARGVVLQTRSVSFLSGYMPVILTNIPGTNIGSARRKRSGSALHAASKRLESGANVLIMLSIRSNSIDADGP